MKKFFIMIAVLAILFTSCSFAEPPRQSAGIQQLSKENSLTRLNSKVPTPEVTTAQERKLVAKRVTRFDVENKLGYVYIFISGSTTPMGYYTIFGKVASLNSFLVPQQRITDEAVVRNPDGTYRIHRVQGYYVLDDADLDGTYGSNVEGVFFFTDDDVYVEIPTNGCLSYFYTDQPLPIAVRKMNPNK